MSHCSGCCAACGALVWARKRGMIAEHGCWRSESGVNYQKRRSHPRKSRQTGHDTVMIPTLGTSRPYPGARLPKHGSCTPAAHRHRAKYLPKRDLAIRLECHIGSFSMAGCKKARCLSVQRLGCRAAYGAESHYQGRFASPSATGSLGDPALDREPRSAPWRGETAGRAEKMPRPRFTRHGAGRPGARL